MSRNDRKAALQRLTEARRRLEEVQANKNPEPWIAEVEYEQANAAVVEAEKAVRFAGMRGWKYEVPE